MRKTEFMCNIAFLKVVYMLYFTLSIYLFVVLSEASSLRSYIFLVCSVIFILCLLELIIFVRKKKGNLKYILVKVLILFLPIMMGPIRKVISYFVLEDGSIDNLNQWGTINLIFIFICCIFFSINLIYHAKFSGFWNKHWIFLIFCLYIFIANTFALIFYTIDKNLVNESLVAFSYSERLEEDIKIRNINNSGHLEQDDFQKSYIQSMINTGKDRIEYVNVDIDEQNFLLTNEKIGKGWSGYYYQNLLKKYNSFSVKNVSPLQLNKYDFKSVNEDISYSDLLDKNYLLVDIVLFNIPREELNGMISLINFEESSSINKEDSEELHLIFEYENYIDYTIKVSNLHYNIFLNFLSESNTLLDNTIDSITILNNAEGSNSLLDYLYYSYVVITTLGFGDMTPISLPVRILTVIEALLGLVIMGVFLSKVFQEKKANKS